LNLWLQAEAAKGRPEAKRWLDQAIIDKAYREREEAREREEQERRRRVKAGAKDMVDTLNVQMKEREAVKEAARKREEVRRRVRVMGSFWGWGDELFRRPDHSPSL
jgi:hypothetical protein